MTRLHRHPRSAPVRCRQRRWVALILAVVLLGLQAVLGTPAAAAGPLGDCKEPPPVEVVGAGTVGSLDPPTGNGPRDSLYHDYSYAGFVWHTYDTPSRWPCVDPIAELSTWVGNRFFDGGNLIVGAVNGMHYEMTSPTGLLLTVDDIVAKGSTLLYHGAALPYLALALVLVAVAIFLHTMSGDLANTTKAVSRVLVGLAVMSATYLSPLLYTGLLDGLLVSGVEELEENLYQQAAPDLGGDVLPRDVLPDLLHRNVVVDTWAMGEFGAADTEFAQRTIPRLIDAQACSWLQVYEGTCPDHVPGKQEEFTRIGEEIRGGAADYATFQGTNSSRIGYGFLGLVKALCFGLFQLVCKIGILIGQLVLRGTVLIGPVLGLLAFAPGVARTAFRAIAGVIMQGLILTAAATAHTIVMVWILDSESIKLPLAKLLLMVIITVLAWILIKPLRRLRNMAAGAVGIPPISHQQWRLERLLRHHNRRSHRRRHHPPPPPLPQPATGDQPNRPTRRTRPEAGPPDLDPVVYARGQRVHTPGPHRPALLDPAPTDPARRRPPRTGPSPRPPHPPGTRTHRDVPKLGGVRTSGSGSGAPGSANGERAEIGSAPPSTELAVRAAGDAGLVMDGELVVPTDLDQRDRPRQRSESQLDPPLAEPDTTEGRTVYRIYRPSTRRVELQPPTDHAPGGHAPPARPEASGWRTIPPWTVDPPGPNP